MFAAIASHSFVGGDWMPEAVERVKKTGTKINFLLSCGNNDQNRPFPEDPEAKVPMNFVKYLDDVPTLAKAQADWKADPYFGHVTYSAKGAYDTVDGFKIKWGTLADQQGSDRLMLVAVEGLGHWNAAGEARFIWEQWFSRFSRGAKPLPARP
jgi:hypothetical protein